MNHTFIPILMKKLTAIVPIRTWWHPAYQMINGVYYILAAATAFLISQMTMKMLYVKFFEIY